MFTKVRTRSVSDEIVDQVISAIFSGKLSGGEKLPAERTLAQAFGVGRQALREAIQQLQGMGLLEVRKSQGTFVRTLTTESLQQPLNRLSRGEAGNFLHFLDIRECMEAMTASEAARQATAEDLGQIEGTLPELRAAVARNDPEALDKADVAFHMAVVAATHSSLLIRLVDTFGNLMWFSHGLRLAILRTENLATVCEEHAAILAALRDQAPERARDAMMHHIQMIRDRVRGMLRREDG